MAFQPRLIINYVDAMGYEIAQATFVPGLIITLAVVALTVLPAAMFGIDMGARGLDFVVCVLGFVVRAGTKCLARLGRQGQGLASKGDNQFEYQIPELQPDRRPGWRLSLRRSDQDRVARH